MKSSSKAVPKAGAAEDTSVLSLLRQIQSGVVHPANLTAETRQSVVEHLSAEGYSLSEIAEILKTSERTVARDRKSIRQANAVTRDPAMIEQMVGQLLNEAQNCICRIRRAARDKEAAPAIRIDAEHRVYLILSDLTQRLQGLGYLPSAGQRIKADVTHQFVESEDPNALQEEITRLLKIGMDSPPGGPSTEATSIQQLGQVLQMLPSPSSPNANADQPRESSHEKQ